MSLAFSPELRAVLTKRVVGKPKEIRKGITSEIRGESSRYYERDRLRQLEAQLIEADGALSILAEEADVLEKSIGGLSDAAFEQEIGRLEKGAEKLLNRIKRYSDTEGKERRFCRNFVHVDEVYNIETFFEHWAQHWIPRKEDIARIVGLASSMHEQLVHAGIKKADEPIRILEVGGSTGFLAQLILRHVKESGISSERFRIDVVDPDADSVQKAAAAYETDPELHFSVKDAAQHAEEVHAGDPGVSKFLRERTQLTQEWKERFAFLARLGTIVEEDTENAASDDLYSVITKSVCDNITASVVPDRTSIKTLGDLGSWLYDVEQQLKEEMNQELDGANSKVEKALLGKRPDYDLVLNSWMPPGIDFTRDIRAANGAAVLYTMERLGATGIQPTADYRSDPKEPGEEASYGPGHMYEMYGIWVGPGTPEAKAKISGKPSPWGTPDASNGFIVEVRKGCPTPVIPEHATGLTKYPWEKDVQQVYKISDKVAYFKAAEDPGANFHQLMEEVVNPL